MQSINVNKLFRKNGWFLSSALILISLCSGCANDQAPEPDNAAVQLVDYFADNGTGNPLAIVQHPAGEHHNGVTYVSYQGPFEDPYVAAYNHQTKEWLGPFRAGTSELGRRAERTKFDNHGKPTLLIDDAGYIHIFYGGHGGDKHHGDNPLGNVHHGANKHSISKKPLDISEWEEIDNISVFGTYNQALKMDNGDIYLFYRHGAHRSDWVYQKSTDNGRTFTPPVSFLKHKRRDDVNAVDSWYPWVGHGQGNDIIVSFDYHLCRDSSEHNQGRGHTAERHDIYYMSFDTESGDWTNVEGESLSIPLTREDAEQKTLVKRIDDLWTFNGSVHLDSQGYPHIAVNAGEDKGAKSGGPKLTRHFRWDGKQWLGGETVNGRESGQSRGDFMLSATNEVNYILASDYDNAGVIAWWHSKNGGDTFTQGKTLLTRKNSSFAITSIIKNAHPDALVLVAEKIQDNADRKIYLLGENGPVPRARQEATLEKDKSTFKQ
ncbi:BNR-4 repeat-containing protein [Thalassotalea litorea]|uniref:BNR-4 repeat-containing protein n=1 Tax=Thalassotalea litorea TaxID=2020715 RepID=UPI003735ADDE